MTAVNPYEAEIHQLESQGVHVIYGTDRGSPPLPALDAEHAAVREGVQALLHSSSQLTIERRLAPHADQLVFTTRNDDDVITLRRHVPGALETLVATRARSRTSLPSTTVLIEINHEKYCIIPASKEQALVFITQGGTDVVQIDDGIESPIIVDSGEGDDFIISAAPFAHFSTGPGDDSVTVFQGSSHIETGPGDDMIQAKFDAYITAYGGPGDDEIVAGGASFIDGGAGNDAIVGGKGHSILSGGPGDDNIEAGASSNVIFAAEGRNEVTLLKPDDMTYHSLLSELAIKLPTSPEEWDRVNAFAEGQPATGNLQIEPGDIQASGIAVSGSTAFVERINDDLRLLHSSPTGQKLLAVLHQATLESGIPISINELTSGFSSEFIADPATRDSAFIEDGQRGTPSYGGQIWLSTADIQPHEPSIIQLFHELCHAYNHVTGTRLHGISEQGADGNRARVRVSNQELQALGLPTSAAPFDFDHDPDTAPTTTNPEPFSENGLRRELGLPLRLQAEAHNH
jgi:hypothetical protein